MAKKTTVPKKTAKLDDKQLDKVQGGRAMTTGAKALMRELAKSETISLSFGGKK